MDYDPSDPDKMKLPPGVTCGDCACYRDCNMLIGCGRKNTSCGWSPSLFVPETTTRQEVTSTTVNVNQE